MKKILIILCTVFFLPTLSHAQDAEAWASRCDKVTEKGAKAHCEIFQRLTVKKTGQRLVEFAIGYPADQKNARGIMILPLGILLQPGATMKIDDNKPFSFKPRYCDAGGCVAYLSLNDTILNMMKKGEKASVTFQSTKPEEISIDLSLKGFTKALKKIEKP